MSASGEPQLAFRPLETSDVEAMSQVHYRACLIAYRFMNWSYSLAQVEAWYPGRLAEWTWTLAALQDGKLAGFIALIDRHIDQLYVDPSFQRAGIGSALLDGALKNLTGQVTLNVFDQNAPARAFYAKYGFQERDRWMNEQEGAIDLLYVREPDQ